MNIDLLMQDVQSVFKSAHMEADVVEVRVEVIEHPAAIKYKGRLQHLLVNLLIVQFLWWNKRSMMTLKFVFLQRLIKCDITKRGCDLKHVPLCADDQCMRTLAGLIRVRGDGHQLRHFSG